MRKFQKPAPKQPINENIKYSTLRVVGDQEQFGVMSLQQALNIAKQQNTDLV